MAKRNKSALKANRQNIKRREHNRALRAKLRTGLKGIRKNLDAKNVEVETSNGTVKLSGTVSSWADHDAAVDAAWSAPGVRDVRDHILVAY